MDRNEALNAIEKAIDDALGSQLVKVKDAIMTNVKESVTGAVAEVLKTKKKKR